MLLRSKLSKHASLTNIIYLVINISHWISASGDSRYLYNYLEIDLDETKTKARIPPQPDENPRNIISKILSDANIGDGHKEDPLKGCAVAAQFELQYSGKKWWIQTLDINGNKKLEGGEELFITFDIKDDTTKTTLVSYSKDIGNGRYLLDFITKPMDKKVTLQEINKKRGGELNIYYIYTCGIGNVAPPKKRNWSDGGFVRTLYKIKMNKVPPTREFKPPALPIGLVQTPFNHVVCVGDSLMRNFAGQKSKGKSLQIRPNGSYSDNVSSSLNTDTVPYFIEFASSTIDKAIQKLTSSGRNLSLLVVLGSGAWDIIQDEKIFKVQDAEFHDHQRAIFRYVRAIKKKYKGNQNISFAWKSPTAQHPHVLIDSNYEVALKRKRYASETRSRNLYKIQKRIMESMNMPFLDLYVASYLSDDAYLDVAHFSTEMNRVMWNWFFPIENTADTTVA